MFWANKERQRRDDARPSWVSLWCLLKQSLGLLLITDWTVSLSLLNLFSGSTSWFVLRGRKWLFDSVFLLTAAVVRTVDEIVLLSLECQGNRREWRFRRRNLMTKCKKCLHLLCFESLDILLLFVSRILLFLQLLQEISFHGDHHRHERCKNKRKREA